MVDPRSALLAFLGLVVLGAVLFWPVRGVVPRLVRVARLSERVRAEDALKHLYDAETRGVACTPESLAGMLQVRSATALRIFGRLQSLGLAAASQDGFVLTEDGRSYALRILRTHRLVERFLADRTGILPGEWHDQAEEWEHRLDEAATERLASRMGQPLYDPHGDPIPTARGVVPEPRGIPLHTAPPGATVTVIHLEDEPAEVFQRLLSSGFVLGQSLRILEVTPARVRFEVEGKDASLNTVLARNVTVRLLPEPEGMVEARRTLADIEVGERAAVVGISAACQGPQRRRLLDLGVVPGTVVTAVMRSAAGDPIAYDVRGALIALRRQQAEWIRVTAADGAEGEAA